MLRSIGRSNRELAEWAEQALPECQPAAKAAARLAVAAVWVSVTKSWVREVREAHSTSRCLVAAKALPADSSVPQVNPQRVDRAEVDLAEAEQDPLAEPSTFESSRSRS